jgi:formate hydrogenlyase subunit 6/NADH:ubiquinone oxidoreductase subunit I
MSFRNLFGKPATVRYPTEPIIYKPMTKGHVVNDIKACILCSICEKKCPAQAIVVDKPGETWAIDRFRCVQCKTCVRECPKDALSMDIHYAPSATEKSIDVVKKPELTPEEKAAKEAKEREKAERVAAAKAKKAAKDAAKAAADADAEAASE